jgi:DNA-binding LacI/PurR family transcriptional regulator
VPLPTQRDLARRLGLSQACVSKALRGASGISDETRALVRRAAEELGYRPDPVLSALVRRRRADLQPAAIAYLRQPEVPGRILGDPYYGHVARRCAELGLRLWLIDRERDDEAVQRRLDERNVVGVIIGHQVLKYPRLAWERMRAVHCGMVVPPESGDVVAPDVAAAIPATWRRMTERGYRRIAAILFSNDARAHSEQLLAGALLALERVVGDPRRFSCWIGPLSREAEAIAWTRRRRPDAVLGYWPGIVDALHTGGVDAAYAAMVGDLGGRPDVAAMHVPFEEIATAAVDLMVQRLRDAPGSGRGRRTHLIEMAWRDGPSLPSLTARHGRARGGRQARGTPA